MSVQLARDAFGLARAFARGATLWCVSPGSPHHARHVAVEFVHPVVAGARALPAVALPDAAMLAAVAAASDAVVVIGREEVATAGRFTIHLGADPASLYDGSVVRAYHVLWELTQICLEHPGLVAA